jgi:hypothetical protein
MQNGLHARSGHGAGRNPKTRITCAGARLTLTAKDGRGDNEPTYVHVNVQRVSTSREAAPRKAQRRFGLEDARRSKDESALDSARGAALAAWKQGRLDIKPDARCNPEQRGKHSPIKARRALQP